MINRKRLIKLTRQLIRINSENPGGNEFKIARFLKGYLEKLGLKTKIYEFQKQRSNLVGILGGRSKQALLISPHLDTVPRARNWHFNPFAAKIIGDKIYGLGATDTKGNLAAALEAIKSLVEEDIILDYNLVFAATADEECGSGLGVIPLLNRGILKPDVAVILDSDDFRIIVAQKGLMHLKVKLQGKRAHGAYPWRGNNAIEAAVNILKQLQDYRFHYRRHRYLRGPTVNIGTIRGGDKVNIVADWCEFELDLRFLPQDSSGEILNDIKTMIKKYSRKFSVEIESVQRPYLINQNHPLVDGLAGAMRKLKVAPRIQGSEGATVITFFQDKGIPAVACGFGSEGLGHTANEYVKISNLYKGARVLEEFLKSYKFV